MKQILTIIILGVILISCGTRTKNDYSIIREKYSEYVFSHKKKKLKESYSLLRKNQDFTKNGLNNDNLDVVIPIFLELRKYDQLLQLLRKSTISDYHKSFYENYVSHLKFRCTDSIKANDFIEDNISKINGAISKNPSDSSLYVDLIFNRLLILGKDSLLIEIDNDPRFSSNDQDFLSKQNIKQTAIEFSNNIPTCK